MSENLGITLKFHEQEIVVTGPCVVRVTGHKGRQVSLSFSAPFSTKINRRDIPKGKPETKVVKV